MASTGTEGGPHSGREIPSSSSYIPDGNPGRFGGGTYTNYSTEPTIRDYENVFGPSARDIKDDLQKYKRHGRWHLPDSLKGPNPWLADRIDGLITDATSSPFTSAILPYKYFENPDGKIKWNVWSFDEAMASRVPYESAARTLTQTKRSFAGYAVRHGLAINLEHNFMMSPAGRENFQNQLQQMIGSIQYSNDLDVHMALILAPSHEKHMREKFMGGDDKSPGQICREFVDLFGFIQKNQNALDIMIEESKYRLKLWGGPMPNFLLCNSKLTFQLTMTPERTNYLTQGPDGVKRLKQGPDISSYRGLNIIHTRAFSLENGRAPRDMLRRRVRVAEYYRIVPNKNNRKRDFEFYNEARDTWFTLSFKDLLKYARMTSSTKTNFQRLEIVIQYLDELSELGRERGTQNHDVQMVSNLGSKMGMDYTSSDVQGMIIRKTKDFIKGEQAHDGLQSLYDRKRDVLYSPFRWLNGSGPIKCLSHWKHSTLDITDADLTRDFYNGGKERYTSNFYSVLAQRCYKGSAIDLGQYSNIQGYNNNFKLDNAAFLNVPPNEPNNRIIIDQAWNKFGNEDIHEQIRQMNKYLIFSQRAADYITENMDRGTLKSLYDICIESYGQGDTALHFSQKVMSKFEKTIVGQAQPGTKCWCWCSRNPRSTVDDWQNKCNDDNLYMYALLKVGTMTTSIIESIITDSKQLDPLWLETIPQGKKIDTDNDDMFSVFERIISYRFNEDMTTFVPIHQTYDDMQGGSDRSLHIWGYTINDPMTENEKRDYIGESTSRGEDEDEDEDGDDSPSGQERGPSLTGKAQASFLADHLEIVIVRPNIEHWMLGIIMGLGGDQLGNTLWGQTELSVYDDSMHGIWGMSYKYHERAIVFNEKNLIRLWDVAYDGYNGGKDDTYVNWTDENDVLKFQEDTADVTKNFTGKSMMVMAFVPNDERISKYNRHFRRNWPSPIQFHDKIGATASTLPVGPDNLHILDTSEFRVFNNSYYAGAYGEYYNKMPAFNELHIMRKSAGDGIVNLDTPTDSLAFQGSMRTKEDGKLVEEINGSGHHGPDFTGAASVRAGKGYKIISQPSLQRLM